MPVVIGLCGYAGSGKDEAAKGLTALGWERVSFADGIRTLAVKCDPVLYDGRSDCLSSLAVEVEEVGWAKAKEIPGVREFLQNLGTGAREVLGESAWVSVAEEKIEDAMDEERSVVITDVRFVNEIRAVYDAGERTWRDRASIVRIIRPGVGPVNGHISETAIDAITPDHEIINDGTPEELQAKLIAYAESLEAVSK